MRRRSLITLVVILLIAALSAWAGSPANPGLHFRLGDWETDLDIRIVQGLDLQGGLQVLLQADLPEGQAPTREQMVAAQAIVEQRINALGVAEPVIQLQGTNRIVVELPGIKDPQAAIRLFGETGLLEFVDLGDRNLPPDAMIPEGAPTVVTGADLKNSDVSFDQQGRPLITFEFKPEGAGKFKEYTEKSIGKYLAIAMDKRVLSAPVVRGVISDRGQIEGRFTLDEARKIVIQLKYGALPVPMKIIQQREVGATLGQDSVRKSIVAGAIGLGVVAAFMLIYYRLPGLLADVALAIYALIVLAIFKNPWQPVVLTLAGIAGFILSIGMAVDANILIFERMKEELRAGRPLGSAIEAGFQRAWSSIRDSNMSTLITCGILFWFGSGLVRGFALVLAIGVGISMFTAITVSRTFLRLLVGTQLGRLGWLYGVPSGQRIERAVPAAGVAAD